MDLKIIGSTIKSMLPAHFRKWIRKLYFGVSFFRFILDDYLHLFWLYPEKGENTLLARVTQEYHRIEKGLSHKYFRFGFGERAVKELNLNLNKYYNAGYNLENSRVKTALSVLNKYIEKHKDYEIDLEYIKVTLNKYNFYDNNSFKDEYELGGVTTYSKDLTLKMNYGNFANLSKSRHSVRFFNSSDVSSDDVLDAISIAQKTPSVCNRQGWYVRLVKSKSTIELFRKVHNGFSSESQNLNCFLTITFRKDFFSYPLERNQGYTDGGLFSMSLLYALTSKGFATCPLNANLTRRNEKLLRRALKIGKGESLVMFIAVGYYEDTFTSPNSNRDDVKDVVKIFP